MDAAGAASVRKASSWLILIAVCTMGVPAIVYFSTTGYISKNLRGTISLGATVIATIAMFYYIFTRPGPNR